jgi:hypothetical protein
MVGKEDDPVHRYESCIEFICPSCNNEIEETIPVTETYWAGDNADERHVQENEVIQCDFCSAYYDVEINNHDGQIFASIPDQPRVEVSASDATITEYALESDRAEYLEDYASEPHMELETALLEIDRMNREFGGANSSTMNRMLFAQQVAAMEAYLCDALLGAVISNADRMIIMLEKDKELKDTKITLADVFRNPIIVQIKCIEHIKSLLFHNLAKTESIYRLISVKIFHNDEIKERLNKAMVYRHDCVHRNGRTKEGVPLDMITSDFVKQNGKDIRNMADYIEGQLTSGPS